MKNDASVEKRHDDGDDNDNSNGYDDNNKHNDNVVCELLQIVN